MRIPDPFESGYPVGLALAPQAWRGAGSDHRLPEVGLAVRRTLHSVLPDEHDELHDTALSRIQPATSNIFLREHALRLRSPSPAMRPSPSPGRRDLEGRYTQSTGDVGLWAEASEEWAEEAVEHQGLMSVKSMTVIPRLSVSRSEKRLGGGSSPLVRTPPRHLTPCTRSWRWAPPVVEFKDLQQFSFPSGTFNLTKAHACFMGWRHPATPFARHLRARLPDEDRALTP